MDLKSLSNTDIIQMQYNLLEELKTTISPSQEAPTFSQSPPNVDDFLGSTFKDEKRTENTGARIKPSAKDIIENSKYSYGDAIEYFAWILNNENSLQKTDDCRETHNLHENFVDNTEKEITRNSPEYKRYREKVLKRDGVCQCCGNKDDLQVHHPLPYEQYPSLRADTSNGIVLCKECHDEYHHKNGYKKDANPVTLAQFLRDYGMNTQSKLLDDDFNYEDDDIVEDFVNKLFISPYIFVDKFKEYADDIIEDRWSIQIDGVKYDTYVPISDVRDMFYTYIHYLTNQKGICVNIAYNTHKVKQVMETHGFNGITKNITNEDGERSSIRVWDKCMLHPTNWDKLNEGMV